MLPKTISNHGFKALMLAALGLISLPAIGHAQSSTSLSSASLERGYGNARAMTEQAFNPSTRDAQGNRVVKNGIILTDYTSKFAGSGGFGGGAASTATGASATAVGNNFSLSVVGNWNTVIVSNNQVNNGDVTATAQSNNQTKTKTAGQLN
jgi:holdfast attachment protein HfaA